MQPLDRAVDRWGGKGAGTPCETDNRVNDATSLSYDLPIKQALHLLGPMTARLWVSSEGGRDSLVTARVEDVSPSGPGHADERRVGAYLAPRSGSRKQERCGTTGS